MLEFSAVLIAKQRCEWNKKKIENDHKLNKPKVKQAWKVPIDKSATKYLKNEANDDNDVEGKDQILALSQFVNYLSFPKNIPPYRKADIVAFIVFTGFYLGFNLIYFYVCINY